MIICRLEDDCSADGVILRLFAEVAGAEALGVTTKATADGEDDMICGVRVVP
jgi:hypothetical protein